MKATLPEQFHPHACADLIRIGRDGDGGYLVSQTDVMAAEVLIGLGINDDWSFEEHFSQLNNCDLFAYDASVGEKKFRKKLLRAIPKFFNFKILSRALKTYLGYKRFFRGNKHHIEQFVGLDYPPLHVGFDHVLTKINARKAFLKIDIEGSEYRVLDQLLANTDLITGMVCEFHDCDLHLDAISRFIADLDMTLVHVHANNTSPVKDQQLPLVLELTFSSNQTSDAKVDRLPHSLDMPNDGRVAEINLDFH